LARDVPRADGPLRGRRTDAGGPPRTPSARSAASTSTGGGADLADLRQKWAEPEARWAGYLAGLSPAALEEVVHRRSVSLGTRLALRRGDVLLHVCTHAHPTAARGVNMPRRAGAGPLPETVLMSLVRREGA
jgi:hypothetical protein